MAGDVVDLRLADIRQAAGERHRHRHGDAGAGADLGHQDRNGVSCARPHRSGLSWAKVHGYRSGENPAQWRNHLDHLLPAPRKVRKVEHHAALPYDEMSDFMRDLRERYGVAALALEFTILCATRTSETLNAAWSEFDLDNAIWTIPPSA